MKNVDQRIMDRLLEAKAARARAALQAAPASIKSTVGKLFRGELPSTNELDELFDSKYLNDADAVMASKGDELAAIRMRAAKEEMMRSCDER